MYFRQGTLKCVNKIKIDKTNTLGGPYLKSSEICYTCQLVSLECKIIGLYDVLVTLLGWGDNELVQDFSGESLVVDVKLEESGRRWEGNT
jgi:hypothetical protein